MSPFHLDFISNDDYEYLAAEISYQEQLVCRVFPRNDDVIEIEFIEERRILDAPVRLLFPLNGFLDIIRVAREELLALTL